MASRLGYPTDHRMVNLRREWNEKIKAEHINASKLINNLLTKYWEYQVCHHCYSSNIHVYDCKKCGIPVINCDEFEATPGAVMCLPTRRCQCLYPTVE